MDLRKLAIAFSLLATSLEAGETITFPSADGVLITADTYIQNEDRETPFIVLFHQASWSRGEYLETAPRLNAMGFNCMAIDQRSGSSVNGVANETKQRAVAAGKSTEFLDAIPDMLAAIAYAKQNFSDGSFIGVGSSYSSGLILKLAGDDIQLVDAVASFSPGEYFSPSNLIRISAATIVVPAFITSRRDELSNWQGIFDAIPSTTEKSSFLPATSGQHGSRALWPEFSDSESYWEAFGLFLSPWLPSLVRYRADNGLAEDGSEDLSVVDDGNVSHLMTYALGGQALPQVVEEEGVFLFQLQRLKSRTDIVFSVEMSTELGGDWQQVWSSADTPYGAGSSASETVRVSLPVDGERYFARLCVTLTP